MLLNNVITTDDTGFSITLTRPALFDPAKQLTDPLKANTPAMNVTFSQGISPRGVSSGGFTGNFSVAEGYLQSNNFQTGVNGWRFTAIGNLEANSGTFRGSIAATTGNIGGWIIDSNGLYYNGVGTPNIRTGATVGAGSNGVIIDKDGIRGYDDVLGVVFRLYSNGSPPEFTYGSISQTTFEINTNAVLRTAATVGDGTSLSAGILINNSGLYGCGASQLLADANVKILSNGDAYFKGTVNASVINSSELNSSVINAPLITGGIFRTATVGQRLEITSQGVTLYSGDTGATYGDSSYKYNNPARTYGTGVLAYINNSEIQVPIYFNSEQSVADIHLFPRSGNPIGVAEKGDVAFVGSRMRICKSSGTPGDWAEVLVMTTSSSSSSSSSST